MVNRNREEATMAAAPQKITVVLAPVTLPREQHERIRAIAEAEGLSIAQVVRDIVRQGLARREAQSERRVP